MLTSPYSLTGCGAVAVTGLHVDIDRIRNDNSCRMDVERKGGLIIWSGRKCSAQATSMPGLLGGYLC